MQRDSKSSPSRGRSFRGCSTCRSRHLKCDERRPACSTCNSSGLACGGYQKGIVFKHKYSSVVESKGHFRRPMLTNEDQERMISWLTSIVKPDTAFHTLSKIDEECDSKDTLADFHISHGPFGAFRLTQPQSQIGLEEVNEDYDEDFFSTVPPFGFGDCFTQLETSLSSSREALINLNFELPDQLNMSSLSNPPDLSWETNRIHEIIDSATLFDLAGFPTTHLATQNYEIPPFPYQEQISPELLNSGISPHLAFKTIVPVPPDTIPLLNHYATTVIASLSPFRHNKTPWHILFLPLAKSCLASLTMGESIDNAQLCVFYGILAISAFSLGTISQSPIWMNQARSYQQKAQNYSRLILKTAYFVPKSAKYKSVLMALIVMAQTSICCGIRDQTELYLLETEKFIRLRGLKRHKSRKVRLLHHLYAYMRIFHESTVICGSDSPQRDNVREAVEKSGLVVYSQDGLSFRLLRWTNLSEEMKIIKNQEDGENDLHLSRPGFFPATLYPEIYGVTEPWVYLLSQVIRLGNEKEAIENCEMMQSLSLKDFIRQAKAIERCISQLQRPTSTNFEMQDRRQCDDQIVERVFEIMHVALSIYFYRRIYDVDSSILQQKVLKIKNWLIQHEEETPNLGGCMGFVWPAFIAACEAEDPQIQLVFSNWFKDSAARYGISCFTETLRLVEKVWNEKKNATGAAVTWLDQMRRDYQIGKVI